MATEQLQAEARERPRIAILAGIAAALTLLATILGLAPGSSPQNLSASLLFYDEHEGLIVASAICSALSAIAIAFVLDFLFRATRARQPDLPVQVRPLIFLGGFGVAAFTIALRIILAVKVSHFADTGSQTFAEAKRAADFEIPALVGFATQLALALAIVVVSVTAMRVGLVTRFLGYVGVFSGVLFVLQFVPIPIVQVYWLGALAALLLGRMRGGLPPAWRSGEAVPWPSAQEMREARIRAAEARRGAGEPAEEAALPAPNPASARRKRKRRR